MAQPCLAANNQVCFKNISTARAVTSDLLQYDYCKKALPLVTLERDLLVEKEEGSKALLKNLTIQTQVYKEKADEYKQLYTSTSQELVKEKENKPSRFTWFSVGAVTAVVAIIAGIFALK